MLSSVCPYICVGKSLWAYTHPAWASALLHVFGKFGNAKALDRGTSNRDKTPARFVYVCLNVSSTLLFKAKSRKSIGHERHVQTSRYRVLALLAGASCFLAGSYIYLCFRSTDLLMFHLFPGGHLPEWVCQLRSAFSEKSIPDWVRYSLPDGLWLLAYQLLIDGIWGGQSSPYLLFFLTLLPLLAFSSEFLQMLHVLPGTGDWADVFFYLMSSLIFLTLKIIMSYEKQL